MVINNIKASITDDGILKIIIKVFILALLGTILSSSSSLVVQAFTGILIMLIFIITMEKGDFFSALMQLFLCNHFSFASYYGGIYNWLFIFCLIIFFISGKKNGIQFNSSFNSTIKWCLIGLFILQLLSVVGGNDFETSKKILAIFTLLSVGYIFYFSSLMEVSERDCLRFLNVICIFFIYMFFVSLNQKELFITSNSAFFPIYADDVDFGEVNITRSSGTFQNYEAYSEYALSIIALLLPGVLSGSFKSVSRRLHILSLITIFLGVIAIVLSATRSSILLLPVLIFIVLYSSKSIKRSNLLFIGSLVGLLLIASSVFRIIDFSVFIKRDEDFDVSSLSISTVLSGEQINRGPLFSMARENLNRSGGLIGGGYFTTPEEYHDVHFKHDFYGYTDYHNLYLSLIVIWGFIGAFLFLVIFFSLCFKGIKLYKRVRGNSSIPNDLLLGFNVMIILFLINEFKIQFNRQVNYFMLILILLAIYSTLIKQISRQEIQRVDN